MDRPTFSVIVPCYNSKPYIARLLKSIEAQHFASLEVVLADDCSPDPYDEEVKPFEKTLHIVRTKTAYNCCPGNTRQAGVDAATGEWLVFADHDDAFYPGVFQKVWSAIRKQEKKPAFVVTDFDEVEPGTDRVLRRQRQAAGWTHGKFYSREFWEKHSLHYKKDLKSHEDIYLSSLSQCALWDEKRSSFYLPITTYKWTAHPESVSRRESKPFILTHFTEYIESTGGVYLDYARKGGDRIFTEYHLLLVVLYIYFYHMGLTFGEGESLSEDQAKFVCDYVRSVKEILGMNNREILSSCAREKGNYFWSTMLQASIAVGPFIPSLTLLEYLAIVAPEEDDAKEDTGQSAEET